MARKAPQRIYRVLSLDGGGSTTMAVEDPVTHVRKIVNVPADNPPRLEASNFAVYSDAVDPVTTATVTPLPNANGWNQGPVLVSLDGAGAPHAPTPKLFEPPLADGHVDFPLALEPRAYTVRVSGVDAEGLTGPAGETELAAP